MHGTEHTERVIKMEISIKTELVMKNIFIIATSIDGVNNCEHRRRFNEPTSE